MTEMDKLWDLVESYRKKEEIYKIFLTAIEEIRDAEDYSKKEIIEALKEALEDVERELNGID